MKSCRYRRKFDNSLPVTPERRSIHGRISNILFQWQLTIFRFPPSVGSAFAEGATSINLLFNPLPIWNGFVFSPTVKFFGIDISDLLPIFAIIFGCKHAFGGRNRYITFRLKNQQNMARFKPKLQNLN